MKGEMKETVMTIWVFQLWQVAAWPIQHTHIHTYIDIVNTNNNAQSKILRPAGTNNKTGNWNQGMKRKWNRNSIYIYFSKNEVSWLIYEQMKVTNNKDDISIQVFREIKFSSIQLNN